MRAVLISLLLPLLAGSAACAGASYGASSDGSFPPRPAGADYPNWEHMCVAVTESNTTKTLNESGAQGWELVNESEGPRTLRVAFEDGTVRSLRIEERAGIER